MFGWHQLFIASVFKGRSLLAVVVVTLLGPLAVFGGIKLDSIVASQSHLIRDCIATLDEQFSSAKLGQYSKTVQCMGTQTVYGRPFTQKVVFKPDDSLRQTMTERKVIARDMSWNMFMCLASALILSFVIWKDSEEKT